jgi:hypothetical protein
MSNIIYDKKSSSLYLFPLLNVVFPCIKGFWNNIKLWILEEKSDYSFGHVLFLFFSFLLHISFDFFSWIARVY